MLEISKGEAVFWTSARSWRHFYEVTCHLTRALRRAPRSSSFGARPPWVAKLFLDVCDCFSSCRGCLFDTIELFLFCLANWLSSECLPRIQFLASHAFTDRVDGTNLIWSTKYDFSDSCNHHHHRMEPRKETRSSSRLCLWQATFPPCRPKRKLFHASIFHVLPLDWRRYAFEKQRLHSGGHEPFS